MKPEALRRMRTVATRYFSARPLAAGPLAARFLAVLIGILSLQGLVACLGLDDKQAGTSTVTDNTFAAGPLMPISNLEGIVRLASGDAATGAIIRIRKEGLIRKPDGTVEPMIVGLDTADSDGNFQVRFMGLEGTFFLEIRQAKGPGALPEAYFKKFVILPSGNPAASASEGPVAEKPSAVSLEHFRLSSTGSLVFRLRLKPPAPAQFWIGLDGCCAFTPEAGSQDTAAGQQIQLHDIPAGMHTLSVARPDVQGGIGLPDSVAAVEIKAGANLDLGVIGN